MLPAQYRLKRKRQGASDRPSVESWHPHHVAAHWQGSSLPNLSHIDMHGFLGLEEIVGVRDLKKIPDLLYSQVDEPFPLLPEVSTTTGYDPTNCVSSEQASQMSAVTSTRPVQESGTNLSLSSEANCDVIKRQRRQEKRTAPEQLEHQKAPRVINPNGFHALSARTEEEQMTDENSIDLPDWQELQLSPHILRALKMLNFTTPSAIQKLSIPSIIAGHNVIGKAFTGSGKTLAYAIPIIEHCIAHKYESRGVSAIIVAPTRELAQQISAHISAAAQYSDIRVITTTGGLSVEKQKRLLYQQPNILVATPGRLWDLLSSNADKTSFRSVRFLVMDEADRLLQTGHFEEISKIIDYLGDPVDRQTMIFSATFQKDLQSKLAGKQFTAPECLTSEQSTALLLKKIRFGTPPLFIDANPKTPISSKIQQRIIQVSPMEKDFVLYYMLLRYPSKTLIFTNSISDVHRLVKLLSHLGLTVLGLHSNKQQKARLKSLEAFRAKQNAILVASDVAARGLDIPTVDLVLHYHLPRTTDLYIHRSGRTARAASKGLSILICSPTELPSLNRMLRALGDDRLPDFPLSAKELSSIKPKVNMARRIMTLEETLRRDGATSKEAWLIEATEDLGIESQETMTESQSELARQLKALRSIIKQMVQEKPVNKQSTSTFLTRGGADLANRILSQHDHPLFTGTAMHSALEAASTKT